jgi:hypothetical protein
MDPNTNLDEQRQLKLELDQMGYSALNAEHQRLRIEKLERLAELAEALDQWLSDGGFLPRSWAVAG